MDLQTTRQFNKFNHKSKWIREDVTIKCEAISRGRRPVLWEAYILGESIKQLKPYFLKTVNTHKLTSSLSSTS